MIENAPSQDRPTGRFEQTPADINDNVHTRAVIDRATGMLMFIYNIDSGDALELLTWRSRVTSVALPVLAERIERDLVGIARAEKTSLSAACDEVLLTAHERVKARHRPPPDMRITDRSTARLEASSDSSTTRRVLDS